MDTFAKFDNLRKIHDFPSKSYRNALKKMGRNLETRLEINTSKFIELGVSTYLKKNKRLIKNSQDTIIKNSQDTIIKNSQDTIFSKLYLEYTEALLTRSCDLIIEIRKKLQNYTKFIDKLDEELNALDFDTSTLKCKHQWHDLEILFSGEGRVVEFINKTFAIQDTKYNTLLVKHIYNIENKREQLEKLISKDNTRVRCIRAKISAYIKAIDHFKKFLESNYVESEYLKKIGKESQILAEAFKENNKISEDFKVPETFKNIEEKILQALKTPTKDKKKIRKQILDDIEEYFSISTEMNIPSKSTEMNVSSKSTEMNIPSKSTEMNVPFIPEFYDIAFDYIKFPPIIKTVEETFASLNIS